MVGIIILYSTYFHLNEFRSFSTHYGKFSVNIRAEQHEKPFFIHFANTEISMPWHYTGKQSLVFLITFNLKLKVYKSELTFRLTSIRMPFYSTSVIYAAQL